MIKGSIQQEHGYSKFVCNKKRAAKTCEAKFDRVKREIDKSAINVMIFNILFSTIDRTSEQNRTHYHQPTGSNWYV